MNNDAWVSHRAALNAWRGPHQQYTPTAAADLGVLQKLNTAGRFTNVPHSILRLAATPTSPDKPGAPSRFTRNNTALKLSWMCYQQHIQEDTCLELMMVLWDGMEQPPRDEYTPAMIERMVRETYKSGKTVPNRPPANTNNSLWSAIPVSFEMPIIDPEDPERVRKLWDKGFAAIPVPAGKGGGRNPKFKHLKTVRPTDQEFQKFSKGWYKKGNAALLFGNESQGIHRLYVIEVEHFEELWGGDQARRDYFLANTPVMVSAKSAHIFLLSDEVVHTTKVDGVVEFRGSNNYSMAPGSIHPSSTPEQPVVYQVLNSVVDTILKVTNVPAFVHSWFPLLFPQAQTSQADYSSSDVPISRTLPYIRDIGTSLEQDVSEKTEQKPALSVAQRAKALAHAYRAESLSAFPLEPGTYVKGGSGAYRRKDDHRHLVIHSGSSETWQEPGNAMLRRRTYFEYYSPLLFDIVEREGRGAIYHFRRHLTPETVEENTRYSTNLHSRIKRHQGDYVEFTILEEDGWWLHTFSNYDDRTGKTEPTVADQSDLVGWLAGLGKASEEYHRPHPVSASEPWQLPRSRTGEWEALGNRFIPDIQHYKDIEDDEYAAAAAAKHITTWLATDEEVMGRAPESILHTRHFQGSDAHTARFMLSFLKNDLGFFLYPKAMAELEAPEPNTAPWDHSVPVAEPPKQRRLSL